MSPDEIFASQMWTWPDPMLKRDAQGRVIVVNAAFIQLYGGQVQDWTGNPVTGWPAPSQTEGETRFEARIPKAEGGETVYDWLEVTLPDGSALSFARDVTQFVNTAAAPVPLAPQVPEAPVETYAPPAAQVAEPAVETPPAYGQSETDALSAQSFMPQSEPAPEPPVIPKPAAPAEPVSAPAAAQFEPELPSLPEIPTAPAIPAPPPAQAYSPEPPATPPVAAEPVAAPVPPAIPPAMPEASAMPQAYAPPPAPTAPQPQDQAPHIGAIPAHPAHDPMAPPAPPAMPVGAAPIAQPAPPAAAPAPQAMPMAAPAAPPAPEAERAYERRALPIEDGDAVLGNNWRDAVIAKAVGVEDLAEKREAEQEAAREAAVAEEKAAKAGTGPKILLAEDNAINALLTRTLLEAEGCVVDVVEDGALAVEAVKNGQYDMIFMDMRMPNMDGLESTRKIRAMGMSSDKLPIVALTANAFDDDRNACFDSGMNDFMTKPVAAEELSEMVKIHTGAGQDRMAS